MNDACAGSNGYLFAYLSAVVTAVSSVLFVDLLPFPLGGYADQRFMVLGLSGFAVLASTIFLLKLDNLPLAGALVGIAPISLLALSFLAFALPYNSQSYAWVEPGMYFFYFMAVGVSGVVISKEINRDRIISAMVYTLAFGCLIYGFGSINVYMFAVFDGVTSLTDYLPWGFVNIRYWSHIATWCLPLFPLAILIGPLRQVRVWRMLVTVGAGLWWWILMLSTARGSFLAVVFAVILTVVFFGRSVLPWLKTLGLQALMGLVFWITLSVMVPSLIGGDVQVRTLSTTSSGRMPLFAEAWAMSLVNFPLGMGPQSWLTHDILTEAYVNSRKFGHPHNMYLMWAAEYGWAFIAVFASVGVIAVRRFLAAKKHAAQALDYARVLLLAGFFASVSGALFHAGLSAVFMAPGSLLIGMFVLAVFWSLITESDTKQPRFSSARMLPSVRFSIIVFLILFLTGWIFLMGEVWTYYEDMRLDETFYYENVGEGIHPRFWFHGNFPRSN